MTSNRRSRSQDHTQSWSSI